MNFQIFGFSFNVNFGGKKHILKATPEVHIAMGNTKYLPENPQGEVFCRLTTPIQEVNVAEFQFLDTKKDPIGNSSPFEKFQRTDNEKFANYFIQDIESRKKFLNVLERNQGQIDAQVLLTDGIKCIYTYKAQQGNWRKTLDGHPNLIDTFVRVKTRII